jgi:carbon-monoxide dehydrogenase iron sulfur subunit
MAACPTGAIYRDTGLDLVLIDTGKCIACAMCAMVCPFDALSFQAMANGHGARTVAVKCDGCADRLRQDLEPACTEACKVDALVFGDLNELAAAGRVREAEAVLSAAAAVQPLAERTPGHVTAWRDWGRSAAEAREE